MDFMLVVDGDPGEPGLKHRDQRCTLLLMKEAFGTNKCHVIVNIIRHIF